ncbi:MAG: recombinase family protein [Phycisphaerales bacterium JB037]
MKPIRCAIYTRKSSEEGLDQAFNSLEAQRQAALDYIRSQRHEGWRALDDRYDDGGYSGGTIKRPALERLMNDLRRGRIDAVVVYKVDRLSRSLSDFASLMEVFDACGASFVSVTQQFNTTNSMGRLTLNMLLSFAQFEREVAGERIRDKIAATKKQGYWVCGQPPLGYRLQTEGEPRGLYIIPEEAELVRSIFERFRGTPSFVEVAERLNELGHSTKKWRSSTGRWHGGRRLSQKYIHSILTNPVYLGKVTHTRGGTTEIYEGRHEPIIDQETWDAVREKIDSRDRKSLHRWTHPHLLKGKLRTDEGHAMSPTSVHRPAKGGKRLIRYYISQGAIRHGFKTCPIKTINANHLDDLVRAIVFDYLGNCGLDSQPAEVRDHRLRELIESVTLGLSSLIVRLSARKVAELREESLQGKTTPPPTSGRHCARAPTVAEGNGIITLSVDIAIKKLDGKRAILTPEGSDLVLPSEPEPKSHIAHAIGRAFAWHERLLSSGQPLERLAEELGLTTRSIRRLLPLTQLSPEILRRALTGTLGTRVSLTTLLETAEHLDWQKQARFLGMGSDV